MPDKGKKCPKCPMRFPGKGGFKRFQKHFAEKHFKSKKKKAQGGTFKVPAFAKKKK